MMNPEGEPEECPECGCPECDGTCCDDERYYSGEEMDGNFESAMVSAGHGMEEDYIHDTPLGEQYSGE